MRRPRGARRKKGIYRRGVHGGGLALAQKALLSEAGDLLSISARVPVFSKSMHCSARCVRRRARSRDGPPARQNPAGRTASPAAAGWSARPHRARRGPASSVAVIFDGRAEASAWAYVSSAHGQAPARRPCRAVSRPALPPPPGAAPGVISSFSGAAHRRRGRRISTSSPGRRPRQPRLGASRRRRTFR